MTDDLFGDLFGEPAIAGDQPAGCVLEPAESGGMSQSSEHVSQSSSSETESACGSLSVASMAATDAIVFDIETGPVASEILEQLFSAEWDETAVKGFHLIGQQFDSSTVKVGNLKDESKILAKVEEKRKEHEKAVAEATINVAKAREEAWIAFVERAPLSAVTGQVLAIGYTIANGTSIISQNVTTDEKAVIARFWELFESCRASGKRLVGFNIIGFDLPFLMRRSWLLGVPVPAGLIHEGRYYDKTFIDLMQVWGCGAYGERIKLDRVAQFFGTARKNGDGANFHRLFGGKYEEREQALQYLRNDLAVTVEVGQRMGVL